MEANERYHFIDIADDSFRALTITCAPDLQEATVFVTGRVGKMRRATKRWLLPLPSILSSIFAYSTEPV
jgi:hypothetical protein